MESCGIKRQTLKEGPSISNIFIIIYHFCIYLLKLYFEYAVFKLDSISMTVTATKIENFWKKDN